MFRDWLPWLFPKFYPLERSLLNALVDSAPEQLRNVLREQVNSIERVRRQPDGIEVYFYYGSQQCRSFPEEIVECRIGRIAFDVNPASGTAISVACDVWLVEGRLFMIQFDQAPKRIMGYSNLKNVRFMVRDDPYAKPNSAT